jgi:glycosyltransferase involved in cell wall biosynthesis
MREDSITVLIPAYNVATYIGACLDSLINQTHTRWQCLCLDDGSQDATAALLAGYAQKDPRIRFFSQANQGVTRTLNALLDAMAEESEYFFFLDADDYIHPQALEILHAQIVKTRADVVECAIVRCRAEPPASFHARYADVAGCAGEMILDMDRYLLRRTAAPRFWINKCNKLYRTQRLGALRFSEELAFEEDYFYALQSCLILKSKCIVPLPLYFYRVNPTSQTGSLDVAKYQRITANRVRLSYEYFVQGQRLPAGYRAEFMQDLARDAFRMILRKSLRKCADAKLRVALFFRASEILRDYVRDGIVVPSDLGALARLTLWAARRKYYLVCRLLVIVA